MGRFINADAYASTGQGLLGNNMYAYCLNNPVCYADTSGMLSYKAYSDDPTFSSNILKGDTGGVGVILFGALIYSADIKKPINLPSHKKVTLDIDHISSGHMPDGPRNPKGNNRLQYLMGHSDAAITMNVYAHASYDALWGAVSSSGQ